MSRLDTDRQDTLTPERMKFAREQIEKLGYVITHDNGTELKFMYNGNLVHVFPYSGWFSGKGVKAGRGIANLIRQIKIGHGDIPLPKDYIEIKNITTK